MGFPPIDRGKLLEEKVHACEAKESRKNFGFRNSLSIVRSGVSNEGGLRDGVASLLAGNCEKKTGRNLPPRF